MARVRKAQTQHFLISITVPMRSQPYVNVRTFVALLLKQRWSLAWVCILCYSPLAWTAPNELVLQLDTGLKLDSNPFRFTDDANTQTAVGTSRKRDSIRSADLKAAALIPLDSPDTRLLLSASLGMRDFQQFNQLDNTESRLRGVLQWRFGELWRGELTTSTENQLFQYIDGSFTQKAMLKGDLYRAEVALKISPDIEIPASIALQKQRYDNANLLTNNRDDKTFDLGGRWSTGTQSVARTGMRLTQSTFIERNEAQVLQLDRQYDDREFYVSSDWQYSVMSRLNGRLGYLHRNYSLLQSRNFSVVTADLQAIYNYSPLTRFAAEVWHRPAGTCKRSNHGGNANVQAIGHGNQHGQSQTSPQSHWRWGCLRNSARLSYLCRRFSRKV